MNNLNKFLTKREDLILICKSKTNSMRMYFIILLFLLAFFLLFPMWKTGYQGFSLWFAWIILLIFLLAKEIIGQKNIYLLSSKRLIHIRKSSKTDYKLIGFIKISEINNIKKQGKNIYIISKEKKYHLASMDKADELCIKIKSYIKR